MKASSTHFPSLRLSTANSFIICGKFVLNCKMMTSAFTASLTPCVVAQSGRSVQPPTRAVRPAGAPLRLQKTRRSNVAKALDGKLRSDVCDYGTSACARFAHTPFPPAVAVKSASAADAKTEDNFIPVMRPEDLPKGAMSFRNTPCSTCLIARPTSAHSSRNIHHKYCCLSAGVRKEVRVEGKSVLVFWYRNQIYAIEARSPAEGAYSEGFIRAKFTQDFAIECPTTGSMFSLKDGSIVSWYPNNAVLRLLTPASTCRPMEIYPVKLTQDAISVNVTGAASRGQASNLTKGGSDTSLENNNVYGLEPKVYVENTGAEVGEQSGGGIAQVATVGVGILAVSSVVVVALAVFKYITQ